MGWVAAIGFGYALAVMAADGVPAPVTAATAHDPLLAYLQAAGFPTWAVVLLLIGRQVSGERWDPAGAAGEDDRAIRRGGGFLGGDDRA